MVANRMRLALWVGRIVAACLIAVCFTGWTPSTLLAQSAASDDAKSCVSCHAEESAAWEISPHGGVDPETGGAVGGASCVDCHGEYVKGHPAEGPMSLKVDSSSCQDCHAGTFAEWGDSYHASEGVQCISCHKPHSQQLRLTDETLCQSCHRESVEDAFHSAHWQGDVTCTSCHLADTPHMQTVASSDPAVSVAAAPSHDFVTVSSANCLDCHSNDVTLAQADQTQVAARTPTTSTTGATGTAAPATTQATPLASATLSAANLGFGLGIGGILGIVFMLIAVTYGFGKKQS